MALFHDSAIAGASGNQATGYKIERSLRFNSSDSAYLSRTPASAGNRKTWTLSFWVKRSALSAGTQQNIFTVGAAGNDAGIYFTGIDSIECYYYAGAYVYQKATSQVFRDLSAWYHIVHVLDTDNSTAEDRACLYINGVRVTQWSASTNPSLGLSTGLINSANSHTISSLSGSSRFFNGYLAEIHFIDGQALTPSSFAETNATTGQWVPKAYTGTYGTNGFRLAFADNSNNTATTLGKDSSPNGNNWTPNNISVLQGNGNYVSGLPTNISAGSSRLNAFDGSLTSRAEYNPGANVPVTWTAPSPISFTDSLGGVEVYVVAGTSSTWFYRLNGGTEYSQSPEGWMKISTGDGTISSISFRNGFATNIALAAVRVNGVLLVDNSISESDSLVDTPTSYGTDTGAGGEVRGNYATLNAVAPALTNLSYANGNLEAVKAAGTNDSPAITTLGVLSGKWYWEVVWTSITSAAAIVGITDGTRFATALGAVYHQGRGYINDNGDKVSSSTTNPVASRSSYGSTWTANDVIGVALDADAGSVTFYKNGVSQGVAFSSLGWSSYFPQVFLIGASNAGTAVCNFGQRPFAYTAPSGFKALCDTNLPAPVVAKPNTAFDVKLYTGNGGTQSVSSLGFSPDLVWLKDRSSGTFWHNIFDSVRGVNVPLSSNSTNAESTRAGTLTSFDSSGFSLGSDSSLAGTNVNNDAFVAWAWDAGSSTVTNTQGSITSSVRANASAGFSVVGFTVPTIGTGAYTWGHGLGVTPSMVIVKDRDNSGTSWFVYHSSVVANASQFLKLNTTDALSTAAGIWGSGLPNSTVVSMTDNTGVFASAKAIAYCFAPVAGYSSFGSYTGNGSADGPFVYTGFRPRWVLIKRTDATADWYLFDTERVKNNATNFPLNPNLSKSETDTTGGYDPPNASIDSLSNGFKLRNLFSPLNGSNATYIYAAFAENPFQFARAR